MKKIKYIAVALTLALMMVTSCSDDGGSSAIELIEGAAPNIQKTPGTETTLNYGALSIGGSIEIGVTTTVARGDVASMDIVGFYTKGTVIEKGVLKAGITDFPSSLTFNEEDLYNAFTVLDSPEDFDITDQLLISADIKLKNGTVIKMYSDQGVKLYGADLSNSLEFSVAQTYIMACPLEDASMFDGDYEVTQDDWADYSKGDIVPVVYDPTFGTLKFKILNTNNPYIANPDTSYMIVTIDPETASVTVTSNEIWDYGVPITVTGKGSVSACTGDINLKLNFTPYADNQTFNLIKKQ